MPTTTMRPPEIECDGLAIEEAGATLHRATEHTHCQPKRIGLCGAGRNDRGRAYNSERIQQMQVIQKFARQTSSEP